MNGIMTRYKVIADWPKRREHEQFKMNDVIEAIEPGQSASHYFTSAWFDLYPNLFKRLEWWKDVPIEQLPEYIKVVKDEVNGHKCKGQVIKCGEDVFWNGKKFKHINNSIVSYGGIMIQVFAPATKQEYIEWKDKK